jgi:hypothetical protein
MLAFEGLAGVLLALLWIYCILDVIATEEMLVRNLPKMVWLLIVIFLPDIGSIAWLILGRPQQASLSPGSTYRAAPRPGARPRAPLGPDDDPSWSPSTGEANRLRQWEAELRAREEELRRRETGGDEDLR